MKKLFLALIGAASALSASAQIKFAAIPEVSVGWTQLPELGKNMGRENAVHVGLGATIGVAKYDDSFNTNCFYGVFVGYDEYGFNGTNVNKSYSNEDVLWATSAFTLGVNTLAKMDCGFSFGAVIGYKVWNSKVSVDGTNYDNDIESDFANNTVAKLKAGYGWNHAILLFEAGFDGGPTAGMNFAFPIFKSSN